MNVSKPIDVCIVGAGLAGLRAAQRLSERGRRVVVLEARDRVGGRTMAGTLCGEAVDLGGQWIGPTQTRAMALCQELGLNLYPQHAEGKRLMDIAGKLRSYRGTVPRMSVLGLLDADRAIRRLDHAASQLEPGVPWKAKNAALWDSMTVEQWMQRTLWTRGGRSLMDILVRAICTCEAHEVSLLCVLNYIAAAGGIETMAEVRGDGAQKLKVRGGAFQLSERMKKKLPPGALTLDAPVYAVEQHAAGVVVRYPGGEVHAARAIVSTAPALAARIDFGRALSAARMQLQSRMPMGSVIKALVAYERPFWREQGWSGEAISDQGAFGPVMDATPPGSPHGFLVGFFNGRHGRALAGATEQVRRDEAVQCLRRYFGAQAASPIGYVDQDWISEPWSLGAYTSIPPPGALTACGPALHASCGRIHWAGTESATRWIGYMDGAIESGERAADEVLACVA